jgi:hypothetical protein
VRKKRKPKKNQKTLYGDVLYEEYTDPDGNTYELTGKMPPCRGSVDKG